MQSMIVETDMAGNYVGLMVGLQLEIGAKFGWFYFAQRKLNG
jgi:hypothetical protein